MANDTQVKYRSNTRQHETGQQKKSKQLQSENISQQSAEKAKQNPKMKKIKETSNQKAETARPKAVTKQANQKNETKSGDDNAPQKVKRNTGQAKNSGTGEQNGSRKSSNTKSTSENKISENSNKTESKNSNGNRNQSNNKDDKRKNANVQDAKGKRDNRESAPFKPNQSSQQKSNPNSKQDAENSSQEQEVNHKEQSGRFETAFNRIHKALREMVKETDSDAFVELLYSGYKNHSLIRKYKSELHQFAKLRNAIVHERVNADFYIAEPHIEVVDQIEEICREFEKPQTALSIATSPVFYYYEDAYLKDVLKVINKFDFTRFPVYDKDDKYVALLTSTEIIQWMAKHFSSEVIHFEDVRIKDLLTKGKNYFVTFVKEETSLYEIEELFERYHTRGKKLQAVIITETGDRHGTPIGVITPWDLLDSEPSED